MTFFKTYHPCLVSWRINNQHPREWKELFQHRIGLLQEADRNYLKSTKVISDIQHERANYNLGDVLPVQISGLCLNQVVNSSLFF